MSSLEVGLGDRLLPGARGVVVPANADADEEDDQDASRTSAGAAVRCCKGSYPCRMESRVREAL